MGWNNVTFKGQVGGYGSGLQIQLGGAPAPGPTPEQQKEVNKPRSNDNFKLGSNRGIILLAIVGVVLMKAL